MPDSRLRKGVRKLQPVTAKSPDRILLKLLFCKLVGKVGGSTCLNKCGYRSFFIPVLSFNVLMRYDNPEKENCEKGYCNEQNKGSHTPL